MKEHRPLGDREAERFDQAPVRATIWGISRGWFIGIVIIVLAGLTSWAIWGLDVGTSDIKGQGEAEKVKNSAANRIRAQEGFEDLFNEIVTADKNINITAEALELDPKDLKSKVELRGQKQYCNDLVGQYNAKARKFTQQEFRAVDLPAQIDDTDSKTDCKENQQ
ncbi:hypothetical protein [Shimazuella alba]|uniref:Uncharacterized protein n=1 Tax=Shimazuella alba TaxID=2690964 RepID=A0A6I4VZ02_9BACL|nr:hypothetical protein [Shimazuella alba]MXQ56011.1 hypothetical protein [Shimazuella alba]